MSKRLLVLGWMTLCGCSGAQAPTISKNSKDKTTAATGDSKVASPDVDPSKILPKDAKALDAQYSMSVSALFPICTGDMTFNIKATPQENGQLFEIPTGKVKCLGGLIPDVDIAAMLKALNGDAVDKTSVFVKGSAIYFKAVQQTEFQPPFRPFMPSFIAGNPAELKNLNITENYSIKGVTEPGSSTLTMNSFGVPATVQLKDGPISLPNTLEFTLKTKGFGDAKDPLGALLFSEITMKISLNPIAIVGMKFVTTLSALQKTGNSIGQFTGPSLGALGDLAPVTIEMKLSGQANLRELVAQSSATK